MGVCLSQSNCRVISSSPAPPLRPDLFSQTGTPITPPPAHICSPSFPPSAHVFSRQVRRQTATGTKWAVEDETWKRIKAFCPATASWAHVEKVHTSVHIKSQQELLVQAKWSQRNLYAPSFPLNLLTSSSALFLPLFHSFSCGFFFFFAFLRLKGRINDLSLENS